MTTPTDRTLVAAIARKDGGVKMIYSDLPLAKSSGEPVDLLADELTRAGMQPEAVDALVARTARATEKRRTRTLDAAERLRKACGDDDIFEALVSGRALVWQSAQTGESSIVLLKVRHATRAPQGTFQRSEPETNVGGLTFRHSGAVHDTIRRLAAQRGKGAPTNEAKPNAGMYGSEHTQNPGRA